MATLPGQVTSLEVRVDLLRQEVKAEIGAPSAGRWRKSSTASPGGEGETPAVRCMAPPEMASFRQEVEEKLVGLRQEVKAEIQSLRQEVKAEIGGLRREVEEKFNGLRQELKGEIQSLRQEVKAEINTAFNKLMLYFTALAAALAVLTFLR